jgi:hypothetical protein
MGCYFLTADLDQGFSDLRSTCTPSERFWCSASEFRIVKETADCLNHSNETLDSILKNYYFFLSKNEIVFEILVLTIALI